MSWSFRHKFKIRRPPAATGGGGGGSFPTITAQSTGLTTFGVGLAQGTATGQLKVGSLQTQTDVKTTWGDGSIKFAIVSAQIPSTGAYTVSASTSSTGTFTPTWPGSTVAFVSSGKTWKAVLPAYASTRSHWLNGALVNEARAIVTPVDSSGAQHPCLSVIFDIRTRANSTASRLDITVDTTKDSSATNRLFYDVTIDGQGSSQFGRANTEQGSFMRWRKTFALGLTQANILHDFSPLQTIKAVPSWSEHLTGVTPPTYTFSTRIGSTFANGGMGYQIMRTGRMRTAFGGTGEAEEIGPYPEWVAHYLTNPSANGSSQVLRQGNHTGAWSVHICSTTGNPEEIVSINTRPSFYLFSTTYADFPANGYVGYGMTEADHSPDSAHQASMGFIPYLMTGDRFYCDQMVYWANFNLLHQPPLDNIDTRNSSNGYLRFDQTRGMAWGLRNMVDAAAYMPDAHPMKTYFDQKITNNLTWLDTYSTGVYLSPIGAFNYWQGGLVFAQGDQTGFPLNSTKTEVVTVGLSTVAGYVDNMLISSPWQHTYLAWSVTHANHLGFAGGSTAYLVSAFNWLVGFFTQASTAWPRLHGAPVWPPSGWGKNSTVNYYTNWTDYHNANESWRGGNICNNEGCVDFRAGGYGREAYMWLAMAKGRGVANASTSLDYLLAYESACDTSLKMTEYLQCRFGVNQASLSS